MKYDLRNLSSGTKENLLADIDLLVQEKRTIRNVTVKDIDTICYANGLDLDYADAVIRLVKGAFLQAAKGLKEDNIIGKTSSDGETSFEAVPEDVARQLDGTTVTDRQGNKTSVKDTGKKTLGEIEGPGKIKLGQQDILNLAKDLDVCTKEALRATGNEVAYTQVFFNKGKKAIVVKAYFQENADNPGKPEGQEFTYKITEGKIVLEDTERGTVTNISAIQTQSGTANINRDLAIDSIKKVLTRGEDTATGEAGTDEPTKDISGKPMMESFGKAVEAYRKNKSKETIKELLRSARDFPGDDIQHKFANAVQAYKSQGTTIEEPGTAEECPECESDCDIKMTESLFIRLLEFAKEDAKDDVDIHEVAENVSRICMEKQCATIEDYGSILGDLAKEDPEDFPEDEDKPVLKGEEPEQMQEIEMLRENDPDEVEDYSDSPKAPESITFYFDTETKDVYDEWNVRVGEGADYVFGTISCAETDYEDQSFSHEFGVENVQVPVCTEVDIEIEGLADDDDHYSSPEDQEQAKSMLTREDYKIIEEWGKDWMSDHLED